MTMGHPHTLPAERLLPHARHGTTGCAQGIRLNQFYAMSVCSPTRISIMTGQNAARHRATNWIRPQQQQSRPTRARRTGIGQGLKPHGDVTLPGLLRDRSRVSDDPCGQGALWARTTREGAEPLNLGFALNIGGASFGAPGSYYGEKKLRARHQSGRIHAVPHLDKYHGSETFLTEALTIEAKARLSKTVKSGCTVLPVHVALRRACTVRF
jgi:hypothetical protein